MKRRNILTLLIVSLLASSTVNAQWPSRLYRRCAASVTPAVVEIQRDGDIDLVPCSGRNVLVNGAATSNTITFTGASRTNFFPYFTTNTNLGKSPFSWDGTLYEFNNTALNGTFIFRFTPSSTATGSVSLGSATTAQLSLGDNAQTASLIGDNGITLTTTNLGINLASSTLSVNSKAGITELGDTGAVGNGTKLTIDDTGLFTFAKTSPTAQMQFSGVNLFSFLRTVTAGGTTGAQTINRPIGTVNFAAGTSAITVTNSTVFANSIVFPVARTNDATCTVKNIVPAAGSFVINMTANCTAETSVGFFVTN